MLYVIKSYYNDPVKPEVLSTKAMMELCVEVFINDILTLVDCFKVYEFFEMAI